MTLKRAHVCEAMGTSVRRAKDGTLSWPNPDSGRALSMVPGFRGVMGLDITYDHQRAFCGRRTYLLGEYRLID